VGPFEGGSRASGSGCESLTEGSGSLFELDSHFFGVGVETVPNQVGNCGDRGPCPRQGFQMVSLELDRNRFHGQVLSSDEYR
jgi:hypothetical protein